MAEREGQAEVIHLWSSPRSASTSLMYSFAQVQDRVALILMSVCVYIFLLYVYFWFTFF